MRLADFQHHEDSLARTIRNGIHASAFLFRGASRSRTLSRNACFSGSIGGGAGLLGSLVSICASDHFRIALYIGLSMFTVLLLFPAPLSLPASCSRRFFCLIAFGKGPPQGELRPDRSVIPCEVAGRQGEASPSNQEDEVKPDPPSVLVLSTRPALARDPASLTPRIQTCPVCALCAPQTGG
jgi:hypothetical protein